MATEDRLYVAWLGDGGDGDVDDGDDEGVDGDSDEGEEEVCLVLDANDGAVLERVELRFPLAATDTVRVSAERHGVYAYNYETDHSWTVGGSMDAWGRPSIGGRTVVVPYHPADGDPAIFGVDIETGLEQWSFPLAAVGLEDPHEARWPDLTYAIGDGTVYFSGHGSLVALEPATEVGADQFGGDEDDAAGVDTMDGDEASDTDDEHESRPNEGVASDESGDIDTTDADHSSNATETDDGTREDDTDGAAFDDTHQKTDIENGSSNDEETAHPGSPSVPNSLAEDSSSSGSVVDYPRTTWSRSPAYWNARACPLERASPAQERYTLTRRPKSDGPRRGTSRRMFPETFETDRLRFEPLTTETITPLELYEYTNSATDFGAVATHLTTDVHETANDARKYLLESEKRWDDATRANWTIYPLEGESIGTFAGVASLIPLWEKRTARLGLWLRKPFWGRGYSSERAAATMAIAFDRLDLEVVSVGYLKGNAKSKRAIEKYVERYGGRTTACCETGCHSMARSATCTGTQSPPRRGRRIGPRRRIRFASEVVLE
ncbi:GNAT family N-acetyltransferase [Saliphagus sp. GCM10025308]